VRLVEHHAGDSQIGESLNQWGEPWRFAMSIPVALRGDFDAAGLRRLARVSKDANQARRLLALATIYAGGTRSAAAEVGGVGLQIVRDWVMRFNADGPAGLLDRKAPGQPALLNLAHRRALATMIETGPIPAAHGVVRWRLVDLAQWNLGRVPDHALGDDLGPRLASDGLPQALGPAPPSCAKPRRRGRF
jgi:transposase